MSLVFHKDHAGCTLGKNHSPTLEYLIVQAKKKPKLYLAKDFWLIAATHFALALTLTDSQQFLGKDQGFIPMQQRNQLKSP